MAKNGIPHQTLAITGPQIAWSGLESRLSGVVISPSRTNQKGRGPTTGLNNQAQFSPDRKLGTAQGRNTRAWMIPRPGKGLSSSRASVSPNVNWSTTDETVQVTVLRSAFQKLASARSSRKWSRPTKPPLSGSSSVRSRNANDSPTISGTSMMTAIRNTEGTV